LNLNADLVNCVKDLYTSGLNTAISGNHSVRFEKILMWITPSEVPRYKMKTKDLIKINLKTNAITGKHRPSREWVMHKRIYENSDANAIVHCHSPFTLGVSISSKFKKIIEADIIVGDPIIMDNIPSGSVDLASIVSKCFRDNKVRAVIIKNHGVVAIGKDLHKARSVVESLEEWSKVLTVSKIFSSK